ncbi:hypothetical protein T265_11366 [Opisthorchis viverrini]|uniref:Uncharacterized protein n=1 Tax=Opisthorchis viverrini TaxID=6198 RepID=A0A074ZXQ9_OPIVI|nr:hypothetical protein T265_11366 [Opisthorchis viverrini]KER19989.1 hypothetical protein T265_11366 [Opisthorchis viverrini]
MQLRFAILKFSQPVTLCTFQNQNAAANCLTTKVLFSRLVIRLFIPITSTAHGQ